MDLGNPGDAGEPLEPVASPVCRISAPGRVNDGGFVLADQSPPQEHRTHRPGGVVLQAKQQSLDHDQRGQNQRDQRGKKLVDEPAAPALLDQVPRIKPQRAGAHCKRLNVGVQGGALTHGGTHHPWHDAPRHEQGNLGRDHLAGCAPVHVETMRKHQPGGVGTMPGCRGFEVTHGAAGLKRTGARVARRSRWRMWANNKASARPRKAVCMDWVSMLSAKPNAK